MLHILVLILINLLVIQGDDASSRALSGEVASALDVTHTDCCPSPCEESEGEDCCDTDFGMCCLSSAAILPPAPLGAQPVAMLIVDPHRPLPPELLHSRATGPPPSPPPIG